MDAQTAFLIFLVVVVAAIVLRRFLPASPGRDPATTAAIDAALAREFPLGAMRIDVKTFDGVVILGGYVRESAQAKRAVEIAQAMPGVKSVDNRIAVRSEG
jgi:Predicted periplasmic or secreted lipoprotein